MQQLQEFVKHRLNGVLDAEWHWYRFEYQDRGSIHCHGCAKLKNDPIRKLCNKACFAFLENETTRYEMSPDDFEFLCGDVIRHICTEVVKTVRKIIFHTIIVLIIVSNV